MVFKICLFFLVSLELTSGEFFVFDDIEGSEFVFELNDPKRIQEARKIISEGKEPKNHLVTGFIIKERKEYNPKWSFHYDPSTIGFPSFQIEVCDSLISYAEEHLDAAGGSFLPNLKWCPWSSKVIREIKCAKKN